ncbi:MAG: hypothetical protein L3J26_07710 [Candidatus Polarisedimenticolaceae bacterium]|nr:hypothetical protein [Candidatus Polarisedimenticolaceae bacterium]
MKKNTHFIFGVVVLLLIGLAGCTDQNRVKPAIKDANLIAINYAAADNLIASAAGVLTTSQPLLITSFVNIDDLRASSTFGRITSEQIGSRFSQSGYPVIEMKLRSSVFIKEQSGEFILSRVLKSLSTSHDAQAVLAGTYAVGSNVVYVTSKLIRTSDGVILSSYDYTLPMGPDTAKLLRMGR